MLEDRSSDDLALVVAGARRPIADAFEYVGPAPATEDGIARDRYTARVAVPDDGDAVIHIVWPPGDVALAPVRDIVRLAQPRTDVALQQRATRMRSSRAVDLDGGESVTGTLSPHVFRDPMRRESEESLGAPFDGRGGEVLATGEGMGWALLRPYDTSIAPTWWPVTSSADASIVELHPLISRARRGSLHVIGPDGAPAAGTAIRRGSEHLGELDEDGAWFPRALTERDLLAGLSVVLEPPFGGPERVPSWHRRLDGAGPWRLTWPTGSLSLQVEPPTGAAIPAVTAVLDTERFSFEAGDTDARIDGIAPGLHRLVVAALGYLANVIDFDLVDGALAIPVVLTPRN